MAPRFLEKNKLVYCFKCNLKLSNCNCDKPIDDYQLMNEQDSDVYLHSIISTLSQRQIEILLARHRRRKILLFISKAFAYSFKTINIIFFMIELIFKYLICLFVLFLIVVFLWILVREEKLRKDLFKDRYSFIFIFSALFSLLIVFNPRSKCFLIVDPQLEEIINYNFDI